MGGICDIPIIGGVCDVVGQGPAMLATIGFDWLAYGAGQAAAWVFESVWLVFDTTTLVDLTNPGYLDVYNVIFALGVFLALIFFCLQLITTLVRREPGGLARAGVGLAKSILGSFIVVTLAVLLLEIVDQLTIGVIQAAGTTLEEMSVKIGLLASGLTVAGAAVPVGGALLTIFLSFMAIAAAFIVWGSLLVRKALILLLVVLAPIALAGSSWDLTKGWVAKWAGFLLAMVLSKLMLAVIFLIAIEQLDAPISFDLAELADPVAGIVMMIVASFAPYLCYKLISFVGYDMYLAMSAEQEAKQASDPTVPVAHRPEAPQKLLDKNGKADGDGDASPPPQASPRHAEPAQVEAPAAESGTAAGGESAAAGGGAAGGAAGAGPAVVAVAAVETVKATAEAGPEAGGFVADAVDGHAGAAHDTSAAPPPQTPPQVPAGPPPAPQASPPPASAPVPAERT